MNNKPTPKTEAQPQTAVRSSDLLAALVEHTDSLHRQQRERMARASGREDYGEASRAQGAMYELATLTVRLKNLTQASEFELKDFIRRNAANDRTEVFRDSKPERGREP